MIETMASDTFVSNIQQWIVLERQLKSLNEKVKQLRDQRHVLSSQICQHIQTNQLQKKKIEIANSGELKMIQKRDYSTFTFGYAESQLRDLVNTGVISQTQMETIMDTFRKNREITTHNEIALYPVKPVSLASGQHI